jgi:hypothetical protein
LTRVIVTIAVFLVIFLSGFSILATISIALWAYYVFDFFESTTRKLAFKEFILLLYGLNFLLAPVLTYHGNELNYGMKISEDRYFSLALPAMIMLQMGMNVIKTKIFTPDFQVLRVESYLNATVLKQWLVVGLILALLKGFFPAELSFLIYLLSGIRYVGAFGLFILNKKKFKWLIFAVFVEQLSESLLEGMFHDMMIWMIFFIILLLYITKPTLTIRLLIGVAGLTVYFFLQISKQQYRSEVSTGGGGFEAFYDVFEKNASSDELLTETNINNSISRVNQAWIFASTVDNMDKTQDFQHAALVTEYLKAAILPRVLAPNKLKAGDKEVFNKFSGHFISGNTSMGLGIFADGYIAYGSFGVYLFAFFFGLTLSLIFKLVERWSAISPFFIFFIFPILNYAVRPDCETQTLLGHLLKSAFAFGLMIVYYRRYFQRQMTILPKTIFKKPE